jgi:hypothetical protein
MLNSLTFQLKDANWLNEFFKNDPTVFCLQETHFSCRDMYRLKVKEWKMLFQENGIQSKLVWLHSYPTNQTASQSNSEGIKKVLRSNK